MTTIHDYDFTAVKKDMTAISLGVCDTETTRQASCGMLQLPLRSAEHTPQTTSVCSFRAASCFGVLKTSQTRLRYVCDTPKQFAARKLHTPN